jgi:dihydrofolate reductase
MAPTTGHDWKVFVNLAISLDGHLAGPNAGPANPIGDHGLGLHNWMAGQAAFNGRPDGETGRDNDLVLEVERRTGAFVLGRRMFDEGEANWGDPSPLDGPVFVLTNTPRESWRRSNMTFHFVTDGIHAALKQAQDATGERDVQISGGADTVRQYLDAGLVDELQLHFAPVLLGAGNRLFDGIRPGLRELTPDQGARLTERCRARLLRPIPLARPPAESTRPVRRARAPARRRSGRVRPRTRRAGATPPPAPPASPWTRRPRSSA